MAAFSDTDTFSQLLPFKWRDIEVPITKMKASYAHDLAEHKYVGVDGAQVEATGLAPRRFQFSAHLGNNIVPGKNENWKGGTLYPIALRALIEAFVLKASGLLQHPEFGMVECKAEKLDLDWDANRRGGCNVEMSFVETLPEDADINLDEPSPVTTILNATMDLDASLDRETLLALAPKLPEYKASFADLARSIQAVGDQVSLLAHRAGGQIDALVYRCGLVSDSVDRAKSALTWESKRNLDRVESAAHTLLEKILAKKQRVVLYKVPFDNTLAGLAAVLPDNTVLDLVKLNPSAMNSPIVKRGTNLLHYTAKF